MHAKSGSYRSGATTRLGLQSGLCGERLRHQDRLFARLGRVMGKGLAKQAAAPAADGCAGRLRPCAARGLSSAKPPGGRQRP